MYVNSFAASVSARDGEHGTDFFDVVHRQRACRSFTDEPVDDESLARILDAATFAPSAENRQPWVFVVVRDAGASRRGSATSPSGHGQAAAATSRRRGSTRSSSRRSTAASTGGGYRGAPVMIVVCADTERCLEATVASSIFPATQNLLLAATALGLGSALTTLTTAFATSCAALLGAPGARRARRSSCRSVTRRDRSARPAVSPSPRTRIASRYGTPW